MHNCHFQLFCYSVLVPQVAPPPPNVLLGETIDSRLFYLWWDYPYSESDVICDQISLKMSDPLCQQAGVLVCTLSNKVITHCEYTRQVPTPTFNLCLLDTPPTSGVTRFSPKPNSVNSTNTFMNHVEQNYIVSPILWVPKIPASFRSAAGRWVESLRPWWLRLYPCHTSRISSSDAPRHSSPPPLAPDERSIHTV